VNYINTLGDKAQEHQSSTSPLPDDAVVYQREEPQEQNEPDFVTAHTLMDRRSYLKFAFGKGARRLGLAIAATGMAKTTYEGQNDQGITMKKLDVDGGLIAGGSMMALKGEIMVRDALKAIPKKP